MTYLPYDQTTRILAEIGLTTTPYGDLVEDETLIVDRSPGQPITIYIYRGAVEEEDCIVGDWDFVGHVHADENGLWLGCIGCGALITVEDAAMCQPCLVETAMNDDAEADAHQREYEDEIPYENHSQD